MKTLTARIWKAIFYHQVDRIRLSLPTALAVHGLEGPRWSYTVTSLHDRHSKAAMIETPIVPRQLEWQEAALLQGFPEDFVFVGSVGRASKMVAQAISIHVGCAILQAICRAAEKNVPIATEAI